MGTDAGDREEVSEIKSEMGWETMTDHLFNKKEIIKLIVDFCTEPCGVLKDDVTAERARFISAGYAVVDEEYTEYYVLNNAGKEMLLRQAEELESELVAFMEEKDGKRTVEKICEWLNSKYEVDDAVICKKIYNYIKGHMKKWKISTVYSGGKGKYEKLVEKYIIH